MQLWNIKNLRTLICFMSFQFYYISNWNIISSSFMINKKWILENFQMKKKINSRLKDTDCYLFIYFYFNLYRKSEDNKNLRFMVFRGQNVTRNPLACLWSLYSIVVNLRDTKFKTLVICRLKILQWGHLAQNDELNVPIYFLGFLSFCLFSKAALRIYLKFSVFIKNHIFFFLSIIFIKIVSSGWKNIYIFFFKIL